MPVVRRDRRLVGVEAVIDKDLTAALLAGELGADRLVMLTDVAYVERDWALPTARPIAHAGPDELRALAFAARSMEPKVEAACRFVELSGGRAAIGALSQLGDVVAGTAGTQVEPAGRQRKALQLARDEGRLPPVPVRDSRSRRPVP